ncbi:hypothetical protein CRM76_14560 [Edwardsiella tarda]|uniref:Uncharacterized protein n=1 Tax=Edwardsiella tarda TaxID=636 RepID=A0A2A7U3T4_EDWTA|nr:hypothetical protein CRM76_14560 [Edwardsiella tarda]
MKRCDGLQRQLLVLHVSRFLKNFKETVWGSLSDWELTGCSETLWLRNAVRHYEIKNPRHCVDFMEFYRCYEIQ